MNLHEKLSQALELCNHPPLQGPTAYRKIGSGAWHDAFLVYPAHGERLVVRLSKPVVYRRLLAALPAGTCPA